MQTKKKLKFNRPLLRLLVRIEKVATIWKQLQSQNEHLIDMQNRVLERTNTQSTTLRKKW